MSLQKGTVKTSIAKEINYINTKFTMETNYKYKSHYGK